MIPTLSHERVAREHARDLAREADARRLRQAALQREGLRWWQRLWRPAVAQRRSAGDAEAAPAKRRVQPSSRSAGWNAVRDDA